MSRHRFVRNIDVHEELEDAALSDGGEDGLTHEEYERMQESIEEIRAIIGSEEQSGLSDSDIKDTLYYYEFDVHKSVDWLLAEQERKKIAKERRGQLEKPLPQIPAGEEWDSSPFASPPQGSSQTVGDESGRSNVPLIRLAQTQPPEVEEVEDEEFFPSDRDPVTRRPSLSTIAENTEYTDDSQDWTPRAQLLPLAGHPPPPSSVTATTDYGEIIHRPDYYFHPNEIPPSPSSSALQRLSYLESAPSMTASASRTPSPKPTLQTPTAPVPPIDTIPEIPDDKSVPSAYFKQGHPSQTSLLTQKSAVHQAEPSISGKKSKLSSLASSRSSTSSKSSRTYTLDASSVLTYPPLRPSAQSMLSFANDEHSSTTGSSSMSSHVRRAIQTAMELEAVDRAGNSTLPPLQMPASPPPLMSASPPPMPTSPPRSLRASPPRSLRASPPRSMRTSPPRSMPPSPQPPISASGVTSPPTPVTEVSHGVTQPTVSPGAFATRAVSPPTVKGRQPSKLAMLAQSKAQQAHWTPKPKHPEPSSPGVTLHQIHTEYLTPIANGPTATTAITTTYQSLNSLTPARSAVPPSTAPTPSASPVSPKLGRPTAEPRQSKLALKSRKALKKAEPESPEEPPQPVLEVPLFSSRATRTRKTHSSRARKEKITSKHLEGIGETDVPAALKPRSRSRKARDIPFSSTRALSPLRGFAFDVPSPDDVVFNARRGTSLAPRSVSTSSRHPRSPPSVGHSSVDAVVG